MRAHLGPRPRRRRAVPNDPRLHGRSAGAAPAQQAQLQQRTAPADESGQDNYPVV